MLLAGGALLDDCVACEVLAPLDAGVLTSISGVLLAVLEMSELALLDTAELEDEPSLPEACFVFPASWEHAVKRRHNVMVIAIAKYFFICNLLSYEFKFTNKLMICSVSTIIRNHGCQSFTLFLLILDFLFCTLLDFSVFI